MQTAMNKNVITVETVVKAPLSKVWECWIMPDHIMKWAFASDEWEAPAAENDVKVGGKFKTTMAAKDRSTSFDFTGTYTVVVEHKLLEYDMSDGRHVKTEFIEVPEGIKVIVTFDPENEKPEEMQRSGWQAISDNFKKHVERT
jgi:uncharacterized protein YndB with AHSA1/START domain